VSGAHEIKMHYYNGFERLKKGKIYLIPRDIEVLIVP
jgi:hypothetical protein